MGTNISPFHYQDPEFKAYQGEVGFMKGTSAGFTKWKEDRLLSKLQARLAPQPAPAPAQAPSRLSTTAQANSISRPTLLGA